MIERMPEAQEIIKIWNEVNRGAARGMPATISTFQKYIEDCKKIKEIYEHKLKIIEDVFFAWEKAQAFGADYLNISIDFDDRLIKIKQYLVKEFKEELGI